MKPRLLRQPLAIRYIFLISCFFLSAGAAAQSRVFQWAASASGPSNVAARVALDLQGNSYVIGNYSDSLAVADTTLFSNGLGDVFVAKYNAAGVMLWAGTLGGPSADNGYAIGTDSMGNVYVAGTFSLSMTIGPFTLNAPGTSTNSFLAKFDTDESVLWARSAYSSSFQSINDLAVDAAGNTYLTGTFEGTIRFGSVTLSSAGNFDIFLAKYDPSGNTLWAKRTGSGYDDVARGIALDPSGNGTCYITGFFKGTVSFGLTQLTSPGTRSSMFVAKCSPIGTITWARKMSSTSEASGEQLGVDATGNCYVCGIFNGTATFGNTSLLSHGRYDVFLAKYTAAGTEQWITYGGSSDDDYISGIAVDAAGNSYLIGWLTGTYAFGSTTLTANGYFDILLARHDAAGNTQSVENLGGPGIQTGRDIAIDQLGNLTLAGNFNDTIALGNLTLTSALGANLFLARTATITALPTAPPGILSAYPNPFTSAFQVALPALSNEPATAVLTDLLGREVHRQVVQPAAAGAMATIAPGTQLLPGVYVLQLRQGETVQQVKVVRQ